MHAGDFGHVQLRDERGTDCWARHESYQGGCQDHLFVLARNAHQRLGTKNIQTAFLFFRSTDQKWPVVNLASLASTQSTPPHARGRPRGSARANQPSRVALKGYICQCTDASIIGSIRAAPTAFVCGVQFESSIWMMEEAHRNTPCNRKGTLLSLFI